MKKFTEILLYFVIFLIFLLSVAACFSQVKYVLPCRADVLCLSKEIAISQIGVRELTGRNDGPRIREYQLSTNSALYSPYCASGQVWCFQTACDSLKISRKEIPIKKTALANGVFNDAQARGKRVAYIPEVNDLIDYKTIGKWTGHIERCITVGKAGWIICVGFNTGSNPREGGSVRKTKRNIFHPLSRTLRIRGLIGFNAK